MGEATMDAVPPFRPHRVQPGPDVRVSYVSG